MTVRTLVGFVALAILSSGASAQVQTPAPSQPAETVYGPGPDIRDPRLLKEVTPKYTSEALRNKIQGQVWLEVVIRADGTVGDVKVIKSLDSVYGLDAEAVAAASQWTFQPATRQGVAVPYKATIELSFRTLDEFQQAYLPDTPGLIAPKVVTSTQPDYTPQAMDARAQGLVTVDVVVLPNGTVSAARVNKGLDQTLGLEAATGLDQQAIRAAKLWTFEPATLNGKPVRALTTLEFRFALK